MNKILPMAKPVISQFNPNDSRKLCSFNVHNDILGELTLDTAMEGNPGSQFLVSKLKNKQGKEIGTEIFSNPDPESRRELTGFTIKVNQEYQNTGKKNFRFGEILRLASIIEMIENNIPALNIYSKDTAIFFHAKYKFIPTIKTLREHNKALEVIATNTDKDFDKFKTQATALIKKIKEEPLAENQRVLCDEANILIQQYIEQVLNKKATKKHPFNNGMDMTLTRDNIIKNREFFNDLYRKHGIDYEI